MYIISTIRFEDMLPSFGIVLLFFLFYFMFYLILKFFFNDDWTYIHLLEGYIYVNHYKKNRRNISDF